MKLLVTFSRGGPSSRMTFRASPGDSSSAFLTVTTGMGHAIFLQSIVFM